MENALQLLPPPPAPLLVRLRRLLAKRGMSHLLRRSRYQHLVQTFGQGTQYLLAHPCTHRDPEFGTRVEHHAGKLSREDYVDLYHCIESWFQEHGASLPPSPTPMIKYDPATGDLMAHVCDSSCPWLIHNTVYYCCWSGAFHNCTAEACEYTESVREVPTTTMSRKAADLALYVAPVVPMRDSRACRITGNAFDLPFGVSFEQSGFQPSDHRRATRVKDGGPSAKASNRWTRRHGFGGDALCTMSSSPEPSPSPTTPSPSPPPPPPRAVLPFKLYTLKNIEEQVLVTAGHINQFMHPPGLDTHLARTLAAEILNTGEKMAVTAKAHGFQFPQTYTPKAHVMTLLTCMATGAEVAHGRVFLPFRIELVGKLLPLDECIRRTGDRNQSKQHTEWNTLLGTIKRAYCRNPPPDPVARIAPLPMRQLRAPREPHALDPSSSHRLHARAIEGSAWLQSLGATTLQHDDASQPKLLQAAQRH